MTNIEIIKQIIKLDKKIDSLQDELSILNEERNNLKKQIKSDNVEVEEFIIKQKILKFDKKTK